MAEFTDADVGLAPSGPVEFSDADVGLAPAASPVVQAVAPPRQIPLDPASTPGLGDRFMLNAREAFQDTVAGEVRNRVRSGQLSSDAATDMARALREATESGSPVGLDAFGDGRPSPYAAVPLQQLQEMQAQTAQEAERRNAEYTQLRTGQRREFAQLPSFTEAPSLFQQAIQGVTALAGSVAGSVPSPENLIAAPVARGGAAARAVGESLPRYIGRTAAPGAAEGIAANVPANVTVQTGQVERGERPEFSGTELGEAIVLGAGIGASFRMVAPLYRELRASIARRKGVTPDSVNPDTIGPQEIVDAINEDPVFADAARANGIEGPNDKRFAILQDRLAKRRLEESLRPAPDNYGADGRPVTSDDWRNTPTGVFSDEVKRRQDELANRGQAGQKATTQNGVTAQTARATEEGTINPQATNVVPREPDTRPIAVQPDGGAYRADEATMQGRDREQVTREARTLRLPAPGREVLTDAEIALQRKKIEGGNQPTVETPPKLYGNESGPQPGTYTIENPLGGEGPETVKVIQLGRKGKGSNSWGVVRDGGEIIDITSAIERGLTIEQAIAERLGDHHPDSPNGPQPRADMVRRSDGGAERPPRAPQTSTDMVGQREAGKAFTLAQAQRGRAGDDVRDTQVAGRPEGANPQQVYLDDGFPVEIVSRNMMPDAKGNMVEVATVRRYDPRTGKPEADAVEYQIPVRQLKSKSYAVEPRMAQDFEARAETDRINAGRDRGKRMDDAQGLPRQTYRQTAPDPDPNTSGRYTRPEQPDGPSPFKKWSNYEEAMRDFADRQSRGQTEPPRSGPDYSKAKSSNQAGPKDRDGRFVVDENGFVMSSAQGPIRFADQKQAAKWILNVGQKQSPDQIFEIAVHPTGKGFTARERGRSEGPPPGDKAGPEAKPQPETQRPAQPETPPRGLEGPRAAAPEGMAEGSRIIGKNSEGLDIWEAPDRHRIVVEKNGVRRETMPGNGLVPDHLRTTDELARGERPHTQDGREDPRTSGAMDRLKARAAELEAQRSAPEPPQGGPKTGPQDNGPAKRVEGPRAEQASEQRAAVASEPAPEPSYDDKVRAERDRLWAEDMGRAKRTKASNDRMVESAARENVMRQEVGDDVIREAEVTGAASKNDITDIAQLYDRKEGQSPQEAWEDAYGKWVDKNESEAMRDANLFTQEDMEFDTLKVDSNSEAGKIADVYTQEAQGIEREARISRESTDNIPFDEVPNGKREADRPADEAGRQDAKEQGTEGGGTRQEARGGREGARDYATDAGPDGGRQTVVPGAERDTRGANQRRADAPLRGGDEAPPRGGLFDEDARNQGDIFDGRRISDRPAGDPRPFDDEAPAAPKEKPAPNPNYRVRVVERVDRSIGMRNVKGNVRERRRTVYVVERKSGDTFNDVGFEFKNRAEAQKYINKRTEAAGSQNSGTTFYSNPFLDPAAWKGLAKSLGVHADYFADQKSRLERIIEAWSAKGGKKTNALADLGRAAFYSADGELRAIGAVYKSPTIKKIADMLFAPADVGRGGAVSRTFHEAVEQRTVSNLNKLSDILYSFRNDKAALNQIRQLIQNPGNIRRGTPIHDAAVKLTELLESEFKYLKDAGVDVGKLVGYFPRIVDAEMVLRNPSDFVEAATRQYMRDGIANNRTEAGKLAQAWLASVELGHAGARKDGTDFVMLGGTPNSDFRKERVFGRSIEADKNNPLAKYYLQDPIDVLTMHFQRTARRAEWARRFGDDLQGWKDLKEQIVKEGNVASLKQVVDAVSIATGTQKSYQSDAARAAVGALRTWGAIRLLPRATITSLSEVAMPAIRSGNLTRVLGDTVRTVGALAGFMKKERALAEDLGLISSAIGDSIVGRRYIANEPGSRVQQDIMNAYFRRTGLEQFTSAVRVMSIAAGQTFIRRLAADVDGAGSRQKSSRAFLRELGVEDADGFAKWLMKTNDGKPEVFDLKADTGYAAVYRTALQRYNQQASLNPNSSTRPKWASHPVGSLVFMLQSYAYAFQKQVLNRAAKSVWEGATGSGYTMADRATMLAPAMLLPVLAAIQYGLSGPRDAVFGDPSSKPKTPEQEYMQAISRAGLTGVLDPLINARTGARYDRDAATAVAGPVLGGLFQTLDAAVKFDVKNSDKTNTAERNLAKAMYDATLMPAVSVLGGFLPTPIGAAVIQGASSGVARNAATSAVAGPKPVERPKPPQRPQPPRPPRP